MQQATFSRIARSRVARGIGIGGESGLPTLSPSWGLALIRIGLGLYFLVTAINKTRSHWWTTSRALTGFVQAQLPHAESWYRVWLQSIVLPHALLFSRLDLLGEWAAGILLLVGLGTPIGAGFVVWLTGNYMLAKGLANPDGSMDRLFALLALVLLLSAAGRVFSLDRLLSSIQTPYRRNFRHALVPPAVYIRSGAKRALPHRG